MALDSERRRVAVDRFERAVELPLLVLALTMVPLLVVPLLVHLPSGIRSTFVALDWLIWAAFAMEYAVRLTLTPERLQFVRREWPDLLIVILPFLRPLRVVRSARGVRLLRLGRLGAFLGEITTEAKRLLFRHRLQYAVLLTVVVVFACGALAYALEEGAKGANIRSFGDALWWSISTMTTVGYGDRFPVTAAGRGVAVFLMLVGIAFVSVLTANVAAFFLERGFAQDDGEGDRLDEILRRLDAIERHLAVSEDA